MQGCALLGSEMHKSLLTLVELFEHGEGLDGLLAEELIAFIGGNHGGDRDGSKVSAIPERQ